MTTLPEGCEMQSKELMDVIKVLEETGFEVIELE